MASSNKLSRRESVRLVAKTSAVLAVASQLGSKAHAAGRHSDPDFCEPVCYLSGTQIETRDGPVGIEKIQIGDEVAVHRGGWARVKWIGTMQISQGSSGWKHRSKPVVFRRGSLGDNVPNRDLYVSQQHAMLLDDVFIPAKYLVNGSSIEIVSPREHSLEYFQIECENHEAVFANGAPAESLFATEDRRRFSNFEDYSKLYGEALVGNMTPYRPIHRFSAVGAKIGALLGALVLHMGVDVGNPVLHARARLKLRARRITASEAFTTRRVLSATSAPPSQS